jgi:Protein of unknown function (DUF3060)
MRYSKLAVAVVVAGSAFAPTASATGQSGGRTSTIECTEETTRVDGVSQRVRLTGECQKVVVSGSGNRVTVERVGSLNVSGMDNEVRWERSLQGDAPRVVSSGLKNSVIRVTPAETSTASAAPVEKPRARPPAPTSPPPAATKPSAPAAPRTTAPTTGTSAPASGKEGTRLVVSQSGQTLQLDCTSRPVSVSGHTNTLTLVGACGQISVSGSGNKIRVERTPRIVTTGHNNEILWQEGDGDKQPSVRSSGMNNIVKRGGI